MRYGEDIKNGTAKSNSPRKIKPKVCVNNPARTRVVTLAWICHSDFSKRSWLQKDWRDGPSNRETSLKTKNRKRIQTTWQRGVSNHAEKWAFSPLWLHEKRLNRRWHVRRDKHVQSALANKVQGDQLSEKYKNGIYALQLLHIPTNYIRFLS